jgi:hypothetical protein
MDRVGDEGSGDTTVVDVQALLEAVCDMPVSLMKLF